jgi:putative redox protein
MEATIRWTSGMTFLAETGSGHVLAMDGAPEAGGRNLAPRPMETVILKKSGQEITGCEVKLAAERATTDPKVFTRIHMHFVVRGKGLKRNLVEHAVRLSRDKYCSASAMLAKTAEITTDFEVVEA